MSTKQWASASLFAALAALLALPAFAAKGEQDTNSTNTTTSQASEQQVEQEFSGMWNLEGGAKQARQKINHKIDQVVSDMLFIKRPTARSKLQAKTGPCTGLQISFPNDEIAVTCDNRPIYRSPGNGQPVNYTSQDGSKYKLKQQLQGRTLIQTFISSDGKRVDRLTLGPDGQTLQTHSKLTSSQLPHPLEYELSYQKQ